MKRRLVIITEIISPYRIPLFNALLDEKTIDPYVIFLSETDPALRQWHVYKSEMRFPYCVLPSWRKKIAGYNTLLNRGLTRALRAAKPDVILCGGYSYVASWQALSWARSNEIPFLLWSESVAQDQRGGHAVVELLKKAFLQRCDGFVVPGIAAREHLLVHGIKPETIFTAPNAVDNEFFMQASTLARRNATSSRSQLALPERYFLFVGRLVPEKGIFDLLAAYDKLETATKERVALVFVGDGKSRDRLEKQAGDIKAGMVKFVGFVHREQLAAYYSLSEALFLPTYTDTWGLVVNEAMACASPIIVGSVAGCVADLVCENSNGIVVSVGDVTALSNSMQWIADQPDLAKAMGDRGLERIQQYSPRSWSEGIVHAVESVARATR